VIADGDAGHLIVGCLGDAAVLVAEHHGLHADGALAPLRVQCSAACLSPAAVTQTPDPVGAGRVRGACGALEAGQPALLRTAAVSA
jgi:hypothetical protein